MKPNEENEFSDADIARLQTKVDVSITAWRLLISCLLATTLACVALVEHTSFLFIVAFLPFPAMFTIQMYERRLNKALIRNQLYISQKRLDKLQKKSAP